MIAFLHKLWAKGLEVLGNCVLFTLAIENLFHVFVLCPFAQLRWKEIKLDGLIYSTSLEVECFWEFLFFLLSKLNASYFGRFAMLLWAIWST